MIRLIGISLLSVALYGCAASGRGGDFITVKPSAAQINAAASSIVCRSFESIFYSKKNDSPETVKKIREHNAAFGSFDCETRQAKARQPTGFLGLFKKK